MLKKYTVQIIRTSYAFRDITIDADSPEQASSLALDEAGNHLYNENDANYSVGDISEA